MSDLDLDAIEEQVQSAYDRGYQDAIRHIQSDSDSALRERVATLESGIRTITERYGNGLAPGGRFEGRAVLRELTALLDASHDQDRQ